jgi:group II intron reverse transcriptase/maturase
VRLGRWQTSEVTLDRLFSMHALRRAWQQVRRSGKSPGTDQVTPVMFEENLNVELNRLRQHLIQGTYQPHPVRRYYVKKPSGRERPISIWTIRDRVAQRVVTDYLTPKLDEMFLDCSHGFRPRRSVDDAVKAVVRYRDKGQRWVLDTDIQDCFGSIDLQLLMGHMGQAVSSAPVVRLVEQWLHAPIEKHNGRTAGVSQGGIISPLLANLYLHHFDQMILAALPSSSLVRFADDLIVLSQTEAEAAWSLEVARRSLENLRLTLNVNKTRIIHFNEGFEFLGVMFLGDSCQQSHDRSGQLLSGEE